ncbi:TetR/AcrR family transcriptional regulator [Phytoactinopolyspora mesophila]|uniref:TetR family transcriptional regulator n=1 Tax=Phytoactinopolyspora mesophila TaxID=2650750 RepID=A0A7K3M6G1_9ACTN|nr:TetR/AcrR family transcriptional regulator [Phytoactinopolyspora mesophila]NDL58820.1 TetR family transcriptional regulator [Phytoactinopolyspora mesophila]
MNQQIPGDSARPAGQPGGAGSRDRLIAAAQELFWSQGVAVTSPRQVMAASGVGQGSFYHHFPSKEDLTSAAIAATAAEALSQVRNSLGEAETPVEQLRGYLSRPRAALRGCRVGRLVYEQHVVDHQVLRKPVEEYFSALIDMIQAVFADLPDTSSAEARRRAYAAVATVQGGYVLSRALGDPEALTRAVEGLLDMLETSAAVPDARERNSGAESDQHT